MKKFLLLIFTATLLLCLNYNAFAQQGNRVKVANNNELIKALDDPNVNSIEITQSGFYDAITNVATAGTIITINPDGSRSSCSLTITKTDVCFTGDPTWNTATAATDGDPSCPSQPTSGPYGWSAITFSGTGTLTFDLATMVNLYNYNAVFSVTADGIYALTYKWNDIDQATINVVFYSSPVITSLVAPDACGTTTDVTYGIDYGSFPFAGNTEVWTIDGNPFSPQPTSSPWKTPTLPCGPHTVSLTVTPVTGTPPHEVYGPCTAVSASDPFFLYDVPTAFAGDNDEICSLTYTLQPTSSASCWGSGSPTTIWSFISGPGTANWSGNVVTVDPCGTYIFEVEIFNGLCSKTDQVTIDFWDSPENVTAGPDAEVCGLTYTLDPDYDLDCESSPVTVAWSKKSGPCAPTTFIGNDVEVGECGLYVFTYTVTNDNCTPVSADVTIEFFDEPTGVTAGSDADVCGLEYTLMPSYNTLLCPNSPTTGWTKTGGPGTFTFTGNHVEVGECGVYVFRFSVTNQPCDPVTADVEITFHERPVPSIDGDFAVFACEEVDYEVLDNRTCTNLTDDLLFLWTVSSDGTIVGDDDEETVTVQWDHNITSKAITPWIKVHTWITGLTDCDAYAEEDVTKESPTLAGQVKYWNSFETYMPTPFPTSINGTYPPDYFYITLYEGTTNQIGTYVLVEPYFIPDGSGMFDSYWQFTLPVVTYECDAQYTLKIWDGGLLYDPNYPTNGFNEYLGAAYTYNNWGGVNATDAYALQQMAAGVDINDPLYGNYSWVGPQSLLPTAYGYYSHGIADVNNSNTITALDALITTHRAVGLIPKYPSAVTANMYSPNFEVTGRMVNTIPKTTWSTFFSDTAANDVPFTHSDADYQYYDQATDHKYTSDYVPWEADNNYMNIYYECLGDINASYVPTSGGFKEEPTMELLYEGKLVASQGEELTIPFSLDNDAQLGALTLNMNYRKDLIEVIGVNYGEDFYKINHEEGIVRIGWYSSAEAINVIANEAIVNISVRILADIETGTRLFELDALTELADATANSIDGINFKTFGVTTDKDALIGTELIANNYPNPFKDKTIISYMLPEAGKVQVVVYSKMGQIVSTIVDQSQDAGTQTVEFNHSGLNAGVYFYKITLNGQTKYYTVTKSMVVVK